MEIEVKAKLNDKEGVMTQLRAQGCVFSEPKTQDDTVYVKEMGNPKVYLSNDMFLRIRIQNGSKVIFTAKKPISSSIEELVKTEFEVVVDSAEQLRSIIELMGFQKGVQTIKTRQTGTFGPYEICIDDIEGLGSYIELEKIGTQEEAAQVQEEMLTFLSTLGISVEDQVKRGYDVMLLEKAAG